MIFLVNPHVQPSPLTRLHVSPPPPSPLTAADTTAVQENDTFDLTGKGRHPDIKRYESIVCFSHGLKYGSEAPAEALGR